MISYLVNISLLFKIMPILSQYTDRKNTHDYLTFFLIIYILLLFIINVSFKNTLINALYCYLCKIYAKNVTYRTC